MTWTYNEALTANKDKVRTLIGDVDESVPQATDEQIAFFLSEEGNNIYDTAVSIVRFLLAKYATSVQKSVGSMSISANQKFDHYLALLEELEGVAPGSATEFIGTPYCGGISKSDKRTRELDGDRVAPAFTRTRFNPTMAVDSYQQLGRPDDDV